jgi:hypothetical protein
LEKLQDRIGLLIEKNDGLPQLHLFSDNIQVPGDFNALHSLESVDSNVSVGAFSLLSSQTF